MSNARWGLDAAAVATIALLFACAVEVSGPDGHPALEALEETDVQATSQELRYQNCQDWEIRAIHQAAGAAKTMLDRTPNDRQYQKWFGVTRSDPNYDWYVSTITTFRGQLRDQVSLLGAAAQSLLIVNVKADCICQHSSLPAYKLPSQGDVIHICPLFFNQPLTGLHSQAGILIHELTHVFGTEDLNWTLKNGDPSDDIDDLWFATQLPIVFGPGYAYWNANNHEYFYENPDRF